VHTVLTQEISTISKTKRQLFMPSEQFIPCWQIL